MAGARVQTARPRAHADQERSNTENPAPRPKIHRTSQENAPADRQSTLIHPPTSVAIAIFDSSAGCSMHFSLCFWTFTMKNFRNIQPRAASSDATESPQRVFLRWRQIYLLFMET